MAKSRSRFFTKSLIGMGAVTWLALTVSKPASAETIGLICHWADATWDMHVSIDPDRQSVVTTIDDRRGGPFAASISDTLIRWTEHTAGSDWERQYTIDRVAGTIRDILMQRGVRVLDAQGQCRRATQKF